MSDTKLYQELGKLTKDKTRWEESIPYVAALLSHDSVRIQAKTLCLLGEMGHVYPLKVQELVSEIASFTTRPTPLLRERAVNALGRIGRGDYSVIAPYLLRHVHFRQRSDNQGPCCLWGRGLQ